MMNKLKLKTVISLAAVLVACIIVILYAQRAKNLSRKVTALTARLEEISPGYQKLSQEGAVLKNENAQLMKENAAVKVDRENLMAQIKTLLPERGRAIELAASTEKSAKELAALTKEKKELGDLCGRQQEELKRLQSAQKELIARWDSLKTACDKAEAAVKNKELNIKLGALQKEKTALASNAKRKEIEFDQSRQQKTKLELENVNLKAQLKDTKQQLAEAVKKNKLMWEDVQNVPKKVAELARQNKLLIAETAHMHYNLGVFYSKNKQYDRAAIEFEKVVEIDPNHAYAHFNLGYIYAEYLVNRQKAAKHFRYYLGLAKSDDRDVDWVKKYLLTWEAYDGKQRVQ